MQGIITYRIATEEDAEALLEIYRPYVESTAVSFETEVPSPDAFRERIRRIRKQYPFLVAEQDGQAIGYSYASQYRTRAGFLWTAELSVYVRQDLRGNGIGTRLFAAVLDLLRLQGYRNAVSVVSLPNPPSEKLHYHFGFRLAGKQNKCGYKNGRWCDVGIFERPLSDYPDPPEVPIPFTQLQMESVEQILKI